MRGSPLPAVFVLFGAIAAAYANSLRGAFQFDDYSVIVNSESVHSLSAWMADHGIRPVLKLSYLLNWTSGLGIVGFHLVNVSIHTANTFLVYGLARRLATSWGSVERPSLSDHFAILAALAFAVHPVQTEAVTYVSGRSTSLMAMFYLASLLTYARGRNADSALLIHLVSPALFVIALLTKETAVTLPVALLLWDRAVHRKLEPVHSMFARQSVHWLLLVAGAIALALNPVYTRLMAVSLETRSLSQNLANQANAIVYLISKMLWPDHLSIDPDLPSVGLWTIGAVARATFLGAIVAIGIVLICRRSPLGFAIGWFFVHLAPTNSIVPRLDVVNERQLYLAGIAFYLMLGAGLCHLQTAWGAPRMAARVVASGLALSLIAITAIRNRDYLTEVALCESTVRSAPARARPHHNLGCAYALARRYEEAARELNTALQLEPDYPLARRNLAAIAALATR